MNQPPFLKRITTKAANTSLTATAACAALVLLTFGTTGCGGAGTPGLSPTVNRTDLSDTNRDNGRAATVATGRMGVFLTATTLDTAPPAAQDAVPTSADLPASSGDDKATPDAPAIPSPDAKKAAPVETPAALPNAAPADKTAPDAKPAAPAANPSVTSAPAPPDDAAPPATTPPSPAAKPADAVPAAKPTADAAPAKTRAKTTDAAQTYNHIWVTVLKVELLDARDNNAVTVWEDAGGLTLDLQTLHDKNGRRFSLVTSAAVPSGRSYDRVRVTMGNGFELFTPGSDTGTVAPLSDTLARDAEGRPIVSFGLARPRDLGTGKDNLFVDFDLRKLQIDGGRVLPVVRESGSRDEIAEGEGVASRQNANQFAGMVTEWTPGKKAGEGAFTLALPSGKTVTVQTTSATGVWNDDGKPSPVVGNTKRVRVVGRLSTQTNRIMAEEVAVYPAASGDGAASALTSAAAAVGVSVPRGSLSTTGLQTAADTRNGGGTPTAAIALASEVAQASAALAAAPLPIPPAQVTGTASHVDDTAGTLTVSAQEAGGIVPAQRGVTVQIVPGAVLRGKNGMAVKQSAFFAELTSQKGRVRAEGEYETATGTLKATRLVLVPDGSSSTPPIHEVIVQGVPAKVSGKSGTFQVANLTEWENIAASSDGKNTVHISLTAATVLRNEKDEFIAHDTFYKAIENPDEKNGINVRVSGTYANGVLTATRIDLRPAPAKPDAGTPPPTVAKTGDIGAATETTAKKSDADGDEAETIAPPPAKNKKGDKSAPAAVPATAPVPAPPLPTIPAPPVVAPPAATP